MVSFEKCYCHHSFFTTLRTICLSLARRAALEENCLTSKVKSLNVCNVANSIARWRNLLLSCTVQCSMNVLNNAQVDMTEFTPISIYFNLAVCNRKWGFQIMSGLNRLCVRGLNQFFCWAGAGHQEKKQLWSGCPWNLDNSQGGEI